MNNTKRILPLACIVFLIAFVQQTQADIYHFETFPGFPEGGDGIEDWGMNGWFETSMTGQLNAGNLETVFENWQVEFFSQSHTSLVSPGNSAWTYVDTADPNFQIVNGTLIKPLGSGDELILNADWDSIGINLGGEHSGEPVDLLIRQYQGSFLSAERVTRNPPSPLFASSIPEPNSLALLLLAFTTLASRRRRRHAL